MAKFSAFPGQSIPETVKTGFEDSSIEFIESAIANNVPEYIELSDYMAYQLGMTLIEWAKR